MELIAEMWVRPSRSDVGRFAQVAESLEQFARQELRFDTEVVEITVVTGPNGVSGSRVGAGHPLGADELWTASIVVTAWVPGALDSGQAINTDESHLVRLADDGELALLKESIRGDSMYSLRVRRGNGYRSTAEVAARNDLVARGFTFADIEEFLLVEILPHQSVPALEKVLAAQTAPKTFESTALGPMVEDRTVGWFERDLPWLGHEIEVSIRAASVPQMQKMSRTIATIADDQKTWHTRAASFLAQELLTLYNDEWSDGAATLDADQFASRLRLLLIHVDESNGSFSLNFDDDNMFGGHSIHLDGNLNGKFKNAGI